MQGKNIFVIGDLIIDHTVFVAEPDESPQPAPGEDVYKVVKRQDTAGGAANSARILGVMNGGKTYLWGAVGTSPWGSFRDILSLSQLLDGADTNISLRGTTDETGAQMDTITRLLLRRSDGKYERKVRFDDTGHLHVTDLRRRSVLHHLRRAHQKTPLHAIIINDLDKGSLTKSLVALIAKFAEKRKIPLFVDPKKDVSKYRDIHGTAILPNLKEWCHLVDKGDEHAFWRKRLGSPEGLAEIARRSARYLGNFKFQVITCDKDGAIVIGPHPQGKREFCVYHIPAVPVPESQHESPLGPGDIVTGVLAFEFEKEQGTESFLSAVNSAMHVAADYLRQPWHRMPPAPSVVVSQAHWDPKATVTEGLRLLPTSETIMLTKWQTEVPGVYSRVEAFRTALARIAQDVRNAIFVKPRSLAIAAPSGAGKNKVLDGIRALAESSGGRYLFCKGVDLGKLVDRRCSLTEIITELGGRPEATPSVLIAVDEATGVDFQTGDRPKVLLDLIENAEKQRVSFIFVDSEFSKQGKTHIVSDIKSRWNQHDLPAPCDRAEDIPLIIGAALTEKDPFGYVEAHADVFLAVTQWILEVNSLRKPIHALMEAYESSKRDGMKPVKVSLKHFATLPYGVSPMNLEGLCPTWYTVSRDTGSNQSEL